MRRDEMNLDIVYDEMSLANFNLYRGQNVEMEYSVKWAKSLYARERVG